jgi:hypothetical protein
MGPLEESKQNDITKKELHKDVPQEKIRPPSPMKGTEQAMLTAPQSGEQSKKCKWKIGAWFYLSYSYGLVWHYDRTF